MPGFRPLFYQVWLKLASDDGWMTYAADTGFQSEWDANHATQRSAVQCVTAWSGNIISPIIRNAIGWRLGYIPHESTCINVLRQCITDEGRSDPIHCQLDYCSTACWDWQRQSSVLLVLYLGNHRWTPLSDTDSIFMPWYHHGQLNENSKAPSRELFWTQPDVCTWTARPPSNMRVFASALVTTDQ